MEKVLSRKFRLTAVAAVAALAITSSVSLTAAENWPQWRGPSLNGTSGETGLPTTWSDTENVAWTLDIAEDSWSGATPIIWEDTIFITVSYLERSTGGRGFGRRGQGRRGPGRPPSGGRSRGGPRPTPAGDPNQIVELWKLDRRDGSVEWKNAADFK